MNIYSILKKGFCLFAFLIFFNAMPVNSVQLADNEESTIKNLEKFSQFFRKEFLDFNFFELNDRKLRISLSVKFANLLQFPIDTFLNFELSSEKIKVKNILKEENTRKIVVLLIKILELQKKLNEKIETFLLLKYGRCLDLQQIQSIKLQSFDSLCAEIIDSNQFKLKDLNSFILKIAKLNLPKFSKYKNILKVGLDGLGADICSKYIKFIKKYRNNKLELQNISEEELNDLLALTTSKLNSFINEKKTRTFRTKIQINDELKIKILLCNDLIESLLDIKNELIIFQSIKQQYNGLDVKQKKIFIKFNSLIKSKLFIEFKNQNDLKPFFCKFLEIMYWYFSNDFDSINFKLKLDELSSELELLKCTKGGSFLNQPILNLVLQYFGIGGDTEFYFIIKKMLLILNDIYSDEIGDDNSFWNSNIVKAIGNKILNKIMMNNQTELPNNFLF